MSSLVGGELLAEGGVLQGQGRAGSEGSSEEVDQGKQQCSHKAEKGTMNAWQIGVESSVRGFRGVRQGIPCKSKLTYSNIRVYGKHGRSFPITVRDPSCAQA